MCFLGKARFVGECLWKHALDLHTARGKYGKQSRTTSELYDLSPFFLSSVRQEEWTITK